MFSAAYDILEAIQVYNWYLGNITAFRAYATESAISKADQAKIRRRLLKAGYKCKFGDDILCRLIKL